MNTRDKPIPFEVGKRYVLRSGAVIELTQIWPGKDYPFLVGYLVRLADGDEPKMTMKMTWGPDGFYAVSGDNIIDIVAEEQVV
jgi:hypothetical protein